MPMPRRITKRSTSKVIRRSVSLSPEVDRKVRVIVGTEKTSANRVLGSLIEAGLEAKEAEKRRFFEVAERFRSSSEPTEIEKAKNELARMIFGG